ncbi:MAG: MgtC/SapB family protein [Acutalibacteraceae bacterium]|jgi:putative Mg2+ transporter-C (MgtC) family protein|nr:MgtC/SapB family protein [Eubacteriales bacterium]MEE1187742.1 MgtC/SapB family protein [Acutalibacteraceae bacterium]MEE1299545.1 MgtC/SapB family protein [Acutalibacteraceae bacterium]MEE3311299.1 MgtC/SapB family protein [Acutalibacteraceae bacterium]
MFSIFDSLRDISILSVGIRLLLTFLCGALIGLEREFKRRPAGFRTHILICVGAAMTTMTGQYLFLSQGLFTDMARLGAQVIAGIGFIGAGTIIVTRRNQIKGLTTAAGLWTCAIVGLAIGAGFYEGGLIATALVLLSELVISNLEYTFMRRHPEINVYLEFRSRSVLETVFDGLKKDNVKVRNLEITRTKEKDVMNSSAIFTLRFQKAVPAEEVLASIRAVDGVYLAEEL